MGDFPLLGEHLHMQHCQQGLSVSDATCSGSAVPEVVLASVAVLSRPAGGFEEVKNFRMLADVFGGAFRQPE